VERVGKKMTARGWSGLKPELTTLEARATIGNGMLIDE
jgi:hypothetical protein